MPCLTTSEALRPLANEQPKCGRGEWGDILMYRSRTGLSQAKSVVPRFEIRFPGAGSAQLCPSPRPRRVIAGPRGRSQNDREVSCFGPLADRQAWVAWRARATEMTDRANRP